MPAHPDFVMAFDQALRGGPLPAGLTARDPLELDRCFAVYRNNVAVGLTEALARRFPVIRRLVGEAFFAALARVYAENDRPTSPVLLEWGAGFAAFLAAFPPLAAYPYMADVARIEYARGLAFHAADAAPVSAAALAVEDPAALRLGLHPSVQLLDLTHPAVSIWARNQPAGEDLPLVPGPQTALILRDAAFQVPVLALEAGDGALMRGLILGLTLGQAAEAAATAAPGHDPQPLLVTLMRAGAITQAME